MGWIAASYADLQQVLLRMKARVHMKPRVHDAKVRLGDAVAAGTTAVGVKPCRSCLRRKEALNRATPSWLARLLTAAARIPASLWKRRGKRPT